MYLNQKINIGIIILVLLHLPLITNMNTINDSKMCIGTPREILLILCLIIKSYINVYL